MTAQDRITEWAELVSNTADRKRRYDAMAAALTAVSIPAAIVEKAAEAKYRRAYPALPWADAPEPTRRYCRDAVVRAITPVYADIQAEAWEEGWEAAIDQAPGDVWFDEWHYQTNPHRVGKRDGGKP